MATGDELNNVVSILKNINDFKTELAKLDLNPRARVYYDQVVFPLLDTFNTLSNASANYATGANNLALVLKKNKIKDVKKLVEDINKKSEDVFEVLEDKIDVLIEISKNT